MLPIDRDRAIEIGLGRTDRVADQRQRGPRQYVAAIRTLIAENAVVEQGEGRAVVNAEKGRAYPGSPRRRRFAEPDMRGENREADVGPDVAVGASRKYARYLPFWA